MKRLFSVVIAALLTSTLTANEPAPKSDVLPAYAEAIINGTADAHVQQAGCTSCGGVSPIPHIVGGAGCGEACACSEGDTCGSCKCKPGKSGSGCCPVNTCRTGCFGFISSIAECLCCPDPCYEPTFSIVANSAFFMDTVRPRTYTRFRWDAGRNLTQPDRAEFFWARTPASGGGRGPRLAETSVNYDELSLYQEIASGNFAFFIETPYRAVDPAINADHANFGDLNLGTKSLLVDCELLNVAFQFRTFIPVGNAANGIGTGHTSLEPSFLSSLKVTEDAYIQSQVAYWIPIGGDPQYQGATWHYHASLNYRLFTKGALQFITTSEINGWTFTDGALTNFVNANTGVPFPASGESYVTTGGGLRIVFCEKWDLGFGAAFAVTRDHFADQLYRTELRMRY